MSDSVLHLGTLIPINYMIGSYPVSALYSGQTQIWSAIKNPVAFVKAEGNWTREINKLTSNTIGNSQSTIEKIYFKNLGGQTITITYDVDSEKNYDYLTIFALDSVTEIIATSKSNGTANGTYGMTGSVDFTFPDNGKHFICIKYSKNATTSRGRDNAIVTFPIELFGEAQWVVVGEVTRYEYDTENDILYRCIYQDLQKTVCGVLTSAHSDGELISKEPISGDILSPNDTIKLNNAPYESVVPEVDPDTVYSLLFGSPTLIVFQNPLKINSWSISTKKNLTEIRGLNFVDTSNVTNMRYMFYNCLELTSLDVSNFDTSNVTDMSYMFTDCSSLTSLNLSGWDTSNVTDMKLMFDGCKGLTSLDVSNFDTSNVTAMSIMFRSCYGLTSLDVSNFDTSNVTAMNNMFAICNGLTSLNLSGWDVSKVTTMNNMFYYCTNLTSLNLSGWDVSKVTDVNSMFGTCVKLTTIIGPITGVKQNIDLKSSPLTHDSAMVILNGLETVTGTKTVKFKSTTYGTLTEAEIAAATAKGWTVQSA